MSQIERPMLDARLNAGESRSAADISWPNAWRLAILLIAVVLIVRLVYMAWWTPWELVGDEAYYWEQARHLSWGYDEKGPALAWLIAGCCHVFGDNAFAVRLPVMVASAVAAWGVGRLTMAIARDAALAGLLAVVCFLLLPAFQANAQICTQDGPLIAIWVAFTAIGLRLFRRWSGGEGTWRDWLLLWAVLGIGFLFKQSILILLPSLLIFWLVRRSALRLRSTFFIQQIVGVCVFLAIISPMIIWDSQHGWPMVEHTLGHLGAGGDQAGHVNAGNPLIWLGSTLGGIVGAIGPAALLLMIWASIRATRMRSIDSQRWPDRLWLMCAAWPSILFFIALSLRKPVVPSWPLPSFVPLVALVGEMAAIELPVYWQRVSRWRAARQIDKASRARKPDTPFHQAWWVMSAYGLVGWILISFPTVLTHLPVIGRHLRHSLIARISGHRAAAMELDHELASVRAADGIARLPVTRHYMEAALDCFYLPGHPAVATAGKYLGKRSTTFDQWADTDLSNPALLGRTLLLIGHGDVHWEAGLNFEKLKPLPGGKYSLAINYRGPKVDYPRFSAEEE